MLLRDTESRRPSSCQPASLLRALRRSEYRDLVDGTVTLEIRVRAHLELVRLAWGGGHGEIVYEIY